MRPLIGITPSLHRHEKAGDIYTMTTAYADAVEAAGGVPLILPPVSGSLEELVAVLDGVVFSGGGDIQPDRYGDRETHPTTYGVSPIRDDFELALLAAALRQDLPVLAICRGIQVLNVGLGGTLYQDVADQYPGALAHQQPWMSACRHDPCHTVTAAPGSPLAEVYGATAIGTNSFHHQAIKRLGDGLQPIGWAEDGLVEAVAHPGRRFVLGVQWHPEAMFAEHREHLRPFERLVGEAATTRERRAAATIAAD